MSDLSQAQLDSITKEASEIVVSYGDGRVKSSIVGDANRELIIDNLYGAHYLLGVIHPSFLSNGDLYIGDSEITDNYLFDTLNKLRRYKGIYSVDYSTLPEPGTPGTPTPPSPSDPVEILRAGSAPVIVGGNNIVFTSPLSTNDYTVMAYVISTVGGYRQDSLGITSLQTSGFIVSDVIKEGTLHYQAIINT